MYNSVKITDDNYYYLNSRARLLQEEGKLLKRLLASSSFPGPQWDVTHTLMASSCSNHPFVLNDFSKQLEAIGKDWQIISGEWDATLMLHRSKFEEMYSNETRVNRARQLLVTLTLT